MPLTMWQRLTLEFWSLVSRVSKLVPRWQRLTSVGASLQSAATRLASALKGLLVRQTAVSATPTSPSTILAIPSNAQGFLATLVLPAPLAVIGWAWSLLTNPAAYAVVLVALSVGYIKGIEHQRAADVSATAEINVKLDAESVAATLANRKATAAIQTATDLATKAHDLEQAKLQLESKVSDLTALRNTCNKNSAADKRRLKAISNAGN